MFDNQQNLFFDVSLDHTKASICRAIITLFPPLAKASAGFILTAPAEAPFKENVVKHTKKEPVNRLFFRSLLYSFVGNRDDHRESGPVSQRRIYPDPTLVVLDD